MDLAWMRERLEKYLSLCDSYNSGLRATGYEYSDAIRSIDREAQVLQPTVERILSVLDPRLTEDVVPLGYSGSDIDRRIRQALGIMADRAEWKKRLAPDSPSLSADSLHPTVWAAAATVWDTGQYRIAVQQATVALSARVKARAQSHLSDRELVSQVFAPDLPKAGQVRLHLPGDAKDRTWQSQQQGLHLMSQGAFAGIRNVATHENAEWSEHEGLEHLAVISVIARWTDSTQLVHPL